MQEALDAISEVQEALKEFGSDMVLNKVTLGAYDPTAGSSETITPVNIKAIVNSSPSSMALAKSKDDDVLKDYEFSIMTYTDQGIDKEDKIIFNGDEYDILLVIPSILQNNIIKYEVLIKT